MQNPLSNKTIEKLKYDLVRDGLLSYEQLSKAEEKAQNKDSNLAQILIQLNIISESDLLEFIESKLHIPCVNLDDYILDKNCLNFISYEEAKNYRIIPLFKIEDVLTLAMADPLDLFLLNNLINRINCKIEPIICSERSILETIECYYKDNKSDILTVNLQENIDFDWRKELTGEQKEDLQAQKIIQSILYQAIIEEVQEIFLENDLNGLNVKFKKNLEFFDKGFIPILLVSLCVSSLKTMAKIDPTVLEIPQVGKLELVLQSAKIIANISTFPTIKGERIVIKVYKTPKQLDKLSINNDDLDLIKTSLNKPGIILVGGSIQNDVNSVIYSLLSSLDTKNKNIMTIESLIKYDLAGINQCEINEKVGFDLNKAIKFIDFQSPDVIYIEDILTKTGIEMISLFAESGKLIITEILSNNEASIRDRLKNYNSKAFTDLISCVIYIENSHKIKLLK